MDQWIIDYQQNINNAIADFFKEHYAGNSWHNEELLHEAVLDAIWYDDSSRIHSILAMVAFEEFLGITAETVIGTIIGLEFIHAGLMLHADITGSKSAYIKDGHPTIKKYGEPLSIVVWDILFELWIDRLSYAWNVLIIREAVWSLWDTGYLRWLARDILTDHSVISEREYLTMYDEKIARSIVSSLVIGGMLAGDTTQLLKDQFRQFGTFLARIYQVWYDLELHESSLTSKDSEVNRERWVVEFLWYDKAKSLYSELYIELMKMTSWFQNSKFKDIVTLFRERSIKDI